MDHDDDDDMETFERDQIAQDDVLDDDSGYGHVVRRVTEEDALVPSYWKD